jgi:glycosyltransferase involved in cell wall biosynthesis
MTIEPEPEKANNTAWPKITLVTPVFNSVRYIEETIHSVISQGYPNLEYFIVDGGSTDGTLGVIRKYEHNLTGWTSQPDDGQADALNRGFAQSSGEIMGWINASDLLHVRSLFLVATVFRELPQVRWITGRPTGFTEDGTPVGVDRLKRWARARFLAGANRYIQQESTFWRRSLWDQAGAHLDVSMRICCDFELWVRFFRYAKLYSVDAVIGGYRSHAGSLSARDIVESNRVQDAAIEAELSRLSWAWPIRAFRGASRAMLRTPVLNPLWRNTVLSALSRLPGPDWPPVIRYKRQRWILR